MLDKEVRIGNVGQITQLERVSGAKRLLDALNADFSSARTVQTEFRDLKLADSRRIPIHTMLASDSGRVIRFIRASDSAEKTGDGRHHRL